jgi:hypothetical protein
MTNNMASNITTSYIRLRYTGVDVQLVEDILGSLRPNGAHFWYSLARDL